MSNTGKFATACLLIGVPGFLVAFMSWSGREEFKVLAYLFSLAGIAAYYVAGWRYGQVAVGLRRAMRAREGAGTTGEPHE